MPEIKLTIGGRDFEVACQEGEENFLTDAANLLNSESQKLVSQLGRLSESRMLLMAGLMLADRMINAEKSFAERELLIKQRASVTVLLLDRYAVSPDYFDLVTPPSQLTAGLAVTEADDYPPAIVSMS